MEKAQGREKIVLFRACGIFWGGREIRKASIYWFPDFRLSFLPSLSVYIVAITLFLESIKSSHWQGYSSVGFTFIALTFLDLVFLFIIASFEAQITFLVQKKPARVGL